MQMFLKPLTLIAACAIFLLFAYTTAFSLAQDGTLASFLSATASGSSLALNESYASSSSFDYGNMSQRHSLRRVRETDTDEVIPEMSHDEQHIQTCSEGLVLPLWMPQTNISWGDRAQRGLVYFLLLLYLFVGVSIISDRFMGAIEAITSTERTVTLKDSNGVKQTMKVRIWNETVANLTLMALGSSAPEILLSVIEIYAKNFEGGDLGPGTIVGSAAYNLFIIIAVCMVAIPTGEVRRIKHLRVFIITATFSIVAYVWLWLILSIISPGIIEVWEGLVTFLMFPVTVIWAYIAERRLLVYKYLDKNYRVNSRGVVVSGERESVEMDTEKGRHPMSGYQGERDFESQAFDEARREYITVLSELRQKYPEADLEQLEMMAQEQMISRGSKSRAFYRVQATRRMIGSGNLTRKIQERAHSDLNEVKAQLNDIDDDDEEGDKAVRIYFEPGHYTVMESCGEFEVRIVRRGDISGYTTVEFETQDGTATAGTDYVGKRGRLTFPPGVDEQRIKVEIIDDDIFEEDECFYIRLFNPTENVTLAVPQIATIMILDDDHAGIFAFADPVVEISESVGIYELVVMRYSGARGSVIVPYYTEDDTAKANKDYEATRGELHFDNNVTEAFISIPIIEESSYEKDVSFKVQLGKPQLAPDDELLAQIEAVERKRPEDVTNLERILLMSKPRNGEVVTTRVRIRESKEFRATVDKLVAKANVSAVLGTSSWKEQFKDALTVVPADESEFDNDEDVEEVIPSCGDYVCHFICLFWKVLFAFVPPTDMCGGYLTFVVSIVIIGGLTAIIGDAATYFGCALNIKDAVTAICFVALGTSIPDTFASLIAAKQDDCADNSIGNVTGSNAVNVFLGIGLAWSLAAIYHSIHGGTFNVEPGTIAFAVFLFVALALIAIVIMMCRRYTKSIGAELGGPKTHKWVHAGIFVFLWLFYIVLSTLVAYDILRL